MAEAFNSVGNNIVSDSAAAINADDVSTVDADESVLGRNGAAGGRSRRRRGDDDEETDVYDDDDMESLISQPVNGVNGQLPIKSEEEVVLPPHACA